MSVLLGLTLLVQGVVWAAPMAHPQSATTASAEVMPCHAHMAKYQTKTTCSLCGAHCNCATACTAAPAVVAGFTPLTLAFHHADFNPALMDTQAVSPHTLDTLRPPIVIPG
jgi:hypothetical protein